MSGHSPGGPNGWRNVRRRLVRALVAAAAPIAATLLAAGCDGLLEVDDPDVAEPEDLTSPTGLQARRLGAFGDFAEAYASSGRRDGLIPASGLFTDELKHTGTFQTRAATDARRVTPRNGLMRVVFSGLQRARAAAEATADAFVETEEAEEVDRTVAEMMILSGYARVLLAETFCSRIPFGRITDEGAVVNGEPRTTDEAFAVAAERFDEAAGRAARAGAEELEATARVGEGRALLGLGRFADAAASVRPVLTGFAYHIRYSDNSRRQQNGMYLVNAVKERVSAVDREGGGVDYLSAHEAGDPRTPWAPAPDGVGTNPAAGLQANQLLYRSESDPVPLATGIEARLVEAEAALRRGDRPAFEALHNGLRARLDAEAVGPVAADTLSERELVDFHFRERALWLWLTAHRLGDLRRLVRLYGRSPEEVYPTGPYFQPQFPAYGSAVSFPVPEQERNNPKFEGCLDDGS